MIPVAVLVLARRALVGVGVVVGAGVDVFVDMGVFVGMGVAVLVAVDEVAVAVLVGVPVGVLVGVAVLVRMGVRLGMGVAVARVDLLVVHDILPVRSAATGRPPRPRETARRAGDARHDRNFSCEGKPEPAPSDVGR
jgi:hypothetical protein